MRVLSFSFISLTWCCCESDLKRLSNLYINYPEIGDRLAYSLDSLIKRCGLCVCADPLVTSVAVSIQSYFVELAVGKYNDKADIDRPIFNSRALAWFKMKSDSIIGSTCTNLKTTQTMFMVFLNNVLKLTANNGTNPIPTGTTAPSERFRVSLRLPFTPLTLEASGTAEWTLKFVD